MLSVVPTPLGNLQDLAPRSLEALRAADAVYCEDTRRTRKLMSHFGLSAPLLRYNEHDRRSVDQALERLKRGQRLALVSDGGTPGVSDPGAALVRLARKAGLPVEALPGPCAAATAVAGSGLPGDSFVFLGFLPRSPGKQRKALAAAAALGRTVVVYESPFRVLKLLALAEEVLGPEAQAVAARELSKLHEEWLTGTVRAVREALAGRKELLGEFVVLLHPEKEPPSTVRGEGA